MTYFEKDGYILGLTMPEYETNIFGGKMSELRAIKNEGQRVSLILPLENIESYCRCGNILACTFRGKEDMKLVRYLNNIGFQFVSTFSTISCTKNEFKPIKAISDLKVTVAKEEDHSEILNIESKVFDYSTYQLDDRFPNEITAFRNVVRVTSYFHNPNHCTYVIRHEGKVIGFSQFLIDTVHKTAKAVNAAVDPMYHGMFVGPKLYSDAFKDIFDWGILSITSGCSNQNTAALKIHQACGFRITEQEIHLRLKL
jgi:ribosomal protein S18 acetylase RimI-like enzyme